MTHCSREVKGDDWDLNKLMITIEGEVEARERALNSTSRTNKGLNRDILTGTTLIQAIPMSPNVPTADGNVLPVFVGYVVTGVAE